MSKKKDEAREALEVRDDASTRTIRVNFRRKARELQAGVADAPRSKKSFEELHEAYKTLMLDREASQALVPKRVTVLSSDVAEYSRMMAEDEEDTLQYFSFCKEVFEEIVAKNAGRVFNTAGDAILAEFSNVANGVECAVEIQRELSAVNLGRPTGRRIQFRIGLNFGDVFAHGEDLLGDTVNVAARIQSAAKPGGVCISQAVFELLGPNTGHSIHSMGEMTFKNIPLPIHTYALAGEGTPAGMPPLPGAATPAPQKKAAPKKSKRTLADERPGGSSAKLITFALLAAIALFAGWKLTRPAAAPVPTAPKAAEPAVAPVAPAPAAQVPEAPKAEVATPAAPDPAEEALVKEAEANDRDSNYRKALVYLKQEKFSEAALLFRYSAQQQQSGSEFELGKLYFAGTGVPKDIEASTYWLMHSARDSNVNATRFMQSHEADYKEYGAHVTNQAHIDQGGQPAKMSNMLEMSRLFLTGLRENLESRSMPVMPGSTW